MPFPPSPREVQLATDAPFIDGSVGLAQLLARYREELLKEFVELQLDEQAMGDVKIARALQDLIDTARGVT